jgi:hypothetical protein
MLYGDALYRRGAGGHAVMMAAELWNRCGEAAGR